MKREIVSIAVMLMLFVSMFLGLPLVSAAYTVENPFMPPDSDWPPCSMKTLDDGYFYVPTVATGILKFELLFSDPGGDQSGSDGVPDGQIDMKDIGLLAWSYGSIEGGERWEYMADVIADREIDMQDIGFVSRHFGRKGMIYSTDFSGVTVTFNGSSPVSPDDGFVMIPEGATWFTVKKTAMQYVQ